jgi:hypothetical protein
MRVAGANIDGDGKAWCTKVASKVAANMTIRHAGAKACGFSTLNPVLSPTSTEGSDTTWGMLVKVWSSLTINQHWSAVERSAVYSISHADLLLTSSRGRPCWPLTLPVIINASRARSEQPASLNKGKNV